MVNIPLTSHYLYNKYSEDLVQKMHLTEYQFTKTHQIQLNIKQESATDQQTKKKKSLEKDMENLILFQQFAHYYT